MMAETWKAAASRRAAGDRTIEWNQTADMAAHRMRHSGIDSLVVVANDRPLGKVTLRDIERCQASGNWLDAVIVLDLVNEPRDTCN